MLVSTKRERFFGGVCGFEKRPLTFRDPPHRHSGIDFRRYALAAHRSGFMQNRSYGLSRMHLPRCLVNKHSVNAPDLLFVHYRSQESYMTFESPFYLVCLFLSLLNLLWIAPVLLLL